ncbi:hypothetical protein [Streptomyces sp. NPDC001507]|uniref:hypothetical protein n=1 Tax=Streptomyces sp. NPDC001507 TaxID=3364579 RepID=UPI0036C27E38
MRSTSGDERGGDRLRTDGPIAVSPGGPVQVVPLAELHACPDARGVFGDLGVGRVEVGLLGQDGGSRTASTT